MKNTKKIKTILGIVGFIAFIAIIGFSMIACDFGDDGIVLTIVNNTLYPISETYVKLSESENWGKNLGNIVGSGSIEVPISKEGIYDIRFVNKNMHPNWTGTKLDISVTKSKTVTLVFDDWDD